MFPVYFISYSYLDRIDDIEDGSDRRRGKPAAHMLFGIPMSINAANYAYFVALEKAFALGHPDVPKIYTGLSTFVQLFCIIWIFIW